MAINFPSGTLSAPTKVLQVVETYATGAYTQSTNGTYELMGRTITPVAAGSKFLLMGKIAVGNGSSQNTSFTFFWSRNWTKIKAGDSAGSRPTGFSGTEEGIKDQYTMIDYCSQCLDSPSYTLGNTLTYRIEVRLDQLNTFTMNRTYQDGDSSGYPRATSNLIVMEIG
jgi:hypothetical protein